MYLLQPSGGRDARPLRRWSQVWALILIAPTAFAVTSMSLTMAAAALVLGFGLPTTTALAMTADSLRAIRVQLPAAIRFGACAAGTCLGFGGLFVFSGVVFWAALAAYGVTAVWAHSTTRTPLAPAVATRDRSKESTAGLSVADPDKIRELPAAALCEAWRLSFTRLMGAQCDEQRAGVVSLRQALLDEMEVRHPDGLRAWLQSGAQAAGGPDQFLGLSDEDGRHTA